MLLGALDDLLARALGHLDKAAIHDVRRALRQARSLVELVPESDALAARLRRVHRGAGGLRDAEILVEVLEELAADGPKSWKALADKATARRDLAMKRAPAKLGKLRGELVAARVSLDELREPEGLRARPGRVRRALARALERDDFDSAHRLRRRIKSFSAQLSLLHPEAIELLGRCDRAAKALGAAADFAVTLDFVAGENGPARLRHRLARELDERRKRGLRRSAKLVKAAKRQA
jgi:CHAD domain-containing protein